VRKHRARYDDPLSTRERRVLWLFAEGHTTDAIAAKLALSPAVVEADRGSAMRKLSLTSDTELVRYVLQQSVRRVES